MPGMRRLTQAVMAVFGGGAGSSCPSPQQASGASGGLTASSLPHGTCLSKDPASAFSLPAHKQWQVGLGAAGGNGVGGPFGEAEEAEIREPSEVHPYGLLWKPMKEPHRVLSKSQKCTTFVVF